MNQKESISKDTLIELFKKVLVEPSMKERLSLSLVSLTRSAILLDNKDISYCAFLSLKEHLEHYLSLYKKGSMFTDATLNLIEDLIGIYLCHCCPEKLDFTSPNFFVEEKVVPPIETIKEQDTVPLLFKVNKGLKEWKQIMNGEFILKDLTGQRIQAFKGVNNVGYNPNHKLGFGTVDWIMKMSENMLKVHFSNLTNSHNEKVGSGNMTSYYPIEEIKTFLPIK